MDIDTDALGIPDTEYDACITMSAGEFGRICRDLSQLGESVRIEVSKEGVRFASDGEAANGNVLLKQTESARERYAGWGVSKKDETAEGAKKEKKTKKSKVKKEDSNGDEGEADEDEDIEEDDGGSFKAPASEVESEGGSGADEDEESSNKKKRKRPSSSTGKKGGVKKAKKSNEDSDTGGVSIEMSQAVTLTFSLKYLVNFAKSGSLVGTVQLKMSNEVPLLVRSRLH